MIKRYTILIFILAFAACAPLIESFGEDYYRNTNSYSDYSEYASDYTQHPNASEYQSILDEIIADGCPGMAVLVNDEYGIWAGSGGVVDFKTNIPWQNNTICRIGSVSKTFCASLLLLLQEDGLVDLDTPLNEILSAETLAGIPNTSASVRQLLNHTSGIPNYTNELEFILEGGLIYSNSAPTPSQALDYIRNKKADFEIGSNWNYSNTNYVLAEMVVEEVTGKESHLLMKERIFDPLGLVSSYYNPDKPIPEGLPRGYVDLYGNGVYKDITNYDVGFYTLDGGIISTIFDLNTFIHALIMDRDFLSEQSFNEMKETVDTKISGEYFTDSKYGLGYYSVNFDGKRIGGHSGGHFSYSSYMFFLEDQNMSFIMLTNSRSGYTFDALKYYFEKL